MERLTKLFEPIKIGGMELKNRIVMAPLGHGLTLAKKDGTVTDEFIAFYAARAIARDICGRTSQVPRTT